MSTTIDFTRINNDVNGNPRYVCHFLNLLTQEEKDNYDVWSRDKYVIAVKRANKIGGKKYHTKSYGGGIVFQSYNLPTLEQYINDAIKEDSK